MKIMSGEYKDWNIIPFNRTMMDKPWLFVPMATSEKLPFIELEDGTRIEICQQWKDAIWNLEERGSAHEDLRHFCDCYEQIDDSETIQKINWCSEEIITDYLEHMRDDDVDGWWDNMQTAIQENIVKLD